MNSNYSVIYCKGNNSLWSTDSHVMKEKHSSYWWRPADRTSIHFPSGQTLCTAVLCLKVYLINLS